MFKYDETKEVENEHHGIYMIRTYRVIVPRWIYHSCYLNVIVE